MGGTERSANDRCEDSYNMVYKNGKTSPRETNVAPFTVCSEKTAVALTRWQVLGNCGVQQAGAKWEVAKSKVMMMSQRLSQNHPDFFKMEISVFYPYRVVHLLELKGISWQISVCSKSHFLIL